jgi:hypothetical protein
LPDWSVRIDHTGILFREIAEAEILPTSDEEIGVVEAYGDYSETPPEGFTTLNSIKTTEGILHYWTK